MLQPVCITCNTSMYREQYTNYCCLVDCYWLTSTWQLQTNAMFVTEKPDHVE